MTSDLDAGVKGVGRGRVSGAHTLVPPPKHSPLKTTTLGGKDRVSRPALPVKASPPPPPPVCSLRGKIWKVLLGVTVVDAEEYIRLVRLGPCGRHDAIMIDLPRTFKSDTLFHASVSQDNLIRVLTAFDHWCTRRREAEVRRAPAVAACRRSVVVGAVL